MSVCRGISMQAPHFLRSSPANDARCTCRSTLLLKRHALTPFAVPAGLRATVRCVLLMRAQALSLQVQQQLLAPPWIALHHQDADSRHLVLLTQNYRMYAIHPVLRSPSSALQASHGIALAPRLTRELWPVIDAVLQRRLRRVGDDVRKSLGAEVDRIALQVRAQVSCGLYAAGCAGSACCYCPIAVLAAAHVLQQLTAEDFIASCRSRRTCLFAGSPKGGRAVGVGQADGVQLAADMLDHLKILVLTTKHFDWQGLPKAAGQSGWGKLMASFQSADDMLDEVNFCVSCLAPLGDPRVAAALRKV